MAEAKTAAKPRSNPLEKRVKNLEKAVALLAQGVNTEEQAQAVKAALGGK